MDKPVIIYSYVSAKGKSYFYKQKVLKDVSKFSNYCLRDMGYETVLYTNKDSKKYLEDIPYSNIVEYDNNIFNKLPPIWSLAKILSMSIESRPFIHIDLDLFIYSQKIFHTLNQTNNVVCLHDENFLIDMDWADNTSPKNHSVDLLIHQIKSLFKINPSNKLKCLNMGLFGSSNPKNIKIINQTAKYMIETFIDAYQNKKLVSNYFERGRISLFTEQIIFLELLRKNDIIFDKLINTDIFNNKKLNIDYERSEANNYIIRNFSKYDLFHLWSFKRYFYDSHLEQFKRIYQKKKNENKTSYNL